MICAPRIPSVSHDHEQVRAIAGDNSRLTVLKEEEILVGKPLTSGRTRTTLSVDLYNVSDGSPAPQPSITVDLAFARSPLSNVTSVSCPTVANAAR